jgi:hypothetical protein
MLYKLYCGRNIPTSTQTVSYKDFINFLTSQKLFEGLTFIEAKGFWNGELEDTFIIEIVTNDKQKVKELARSYKTIFTQESVLLIETKDITDFI